MPLKANIADREFDRFGHDENTGRTFVYTSNMSDPLSGKAWDLMTVTYPANKVEIYTYSFNAVTVATITDTYQNNAKTILLTRAVS